MLAETSRVDSSSFAPLRLDRIFYHERACHPLSPQIGQNRDSYYTQESSMRFLSLALVILCAPVATLAQTVTYQLRGFPSTGGALLNLLHLYIP